MIAELRDELAGVVAGLGVVVHRTVPEELIPPCVVIQPADPFVTDDDPDATFGEPYSIAFELLLLVPLDSEHGNEQASDQLDTMLGDLLGWLRQSRWTLSSMGQPAPHMTTDWIEHGQRVIVRRPVSL